MFFRLRNFRFSKPNRDRGIDPPKLLKLKSKEVTLEGRLWGSTPVKELWDTVKYCKEVRLDNVEGSDLVRQL